MRLSPFVLIFTLFLVQPANTMAYGVTGDFVALDNNIQEFSSFEGNLLIVDATASWCTACDQQLQQLATVFDSARDKVNILTLGIDTSEEVSHIIELKDRFSSPWTFGLDKTGTFISQNSVSVLPTLFLLSEGGAVLDRWEGLTPAGVLIGAVNERLGTPIEFEQGDFEEEFQESVIGDILNNNGFRLFAFSLIAVFFYLKLTPNKTVPNGKSSSKASMKLSSKKNKISKTLNKKSKSINSERGLKSKKNRSKIRRTSR